MIRPDFLYIGIARAGSTWLFNMLREHPEVMVPHPRSSTWRIS